VYAGRCRFTFNGSRVFREASIAACLFFSACGPWHQDLPTGSPVTFAVFDVGEGLAQAVVSEGCAVLFDMGPPDGYPLLKKQYEGLGSPPIKAIALSHGHLDHYGGLTMLDSGTAWTGLMIVTPYIDTAFIRAIMPQWRDRLCFRLVHARDTVAVLNNIKIRCLWPPDTAGDSLFTVDSLKNRFSTVFMVSSGMMRALITSDIDTCGMRRLSLREENSLTAEIMVVPHHGSAGSLDPVFYGHVRPLAAVISCSADNLYGHPSPSVLLWLTQAGAVVKITFLEGPVIVRGNGYSWNLP
jgi:competence protein ComEC